MLSIPATRCALGAVRTLSNCVASQCRVQGRSRAAHSWVAADSWSRLVASVQYARGTGSACI